MSTPNLRHDDVDGEYCDGLFGEFDSMDEDGELTHDAQVLVDSIKHNDLGWEHL